MINFMEDKAHADRAAILRSLAHRREHTTWYIAIKPSQQRSNPLTKECETMKFLSKDTEMAGNLFLPAHYDGRKQLAK